MEGSRVIYIPALIERGSQVIYLSLDILYLTPALVSYHTGYVHCQAFTTLDKFESNKVVYDFPRKVHEKSRKLATS